MITTIWSVLSNTVPDHSIKRGIEIPMIQRDYAQGRRNSKASEIRKVFLNKMLSSIRAVIHDNKQPLELDFVYGYIQSEAFIPLDGQQRLTTLYLLHWYFAFKEQRLAEFKHALTNFKYQTRQSSEDFIKNINERLSADDHHEIFAGNKSFQSVLTDKNWYFVNWKYDLTIQSAITMLDEIHLTFNTSEVTLNDLISETKPCIVFNFLNIENFGLSDDLYIKMNARGKPLTNFENLKAELGRFIKLSDFNDKYQYALKHSAGNKPVDVETYFVTKTDTAWSDFFWKIKNKETKEFDDKLLNVLAFVSLNELVKTDVNEFDRCLRHLDKYDADLSYYLFISLNLLNEQSIINYIDTLDLLASENSAIKTYLNDERFLDKQDVIANAYNRNFKARYDERVFFYALFKFLIIPQNAFDEQEFQKWDRLVYNLVTNTIYNTPKHFQDSIIAIDTIVAAYDGNVYQTFLNLDVKGFDAQQTREEKLKIELINKGSSWTEFIHNAELHGYLDGQIMFLLSFSGIYDKYLAEELDWIPEKEALYFDKLTMYFDKFNLLFTQTGLRKFDNELTRRALLVKGDYLLYSTNKSLLIDNHRDISWKRLLKETGNKSSEYFSKRCKYLQELFDDVDVQDAEGSLKQIIKGHSCTDWRKEFIDHPVLMNTSYEKYLKFFDNGNIYVLRKSKYNRYADPEAKSIILRELLKKRGIAEHEIELGYVENLNQFGIVRIKSRKPRIVYNHNGSKAYLIKQKGVEDFQTDKPTEVVNFIIDNF
jgi:hypothetical protein